MNRKKIMVTHRDVKAAGIVIVGLTLSHRIPHRGVPRSPMTTETIITFE